MSTKLAGLSGSLLTPLLATALEEFRVRNHALTWIKQISSGQPIIKHDLDIDKKALCVVQGGPAKVVACEPVGGSAWEFPTGTSGRPSYSGGVNLTTCSRQRAWHGNCLKCLSDVAKGPCCGGRGAGGARPPPTPQGRPPPPPLTIVTHLSTCEQLGMDHGIAPKHDGPR